MNELNNLGASIILCILCTLLPFTAWSQGSDDQTSGMQFLEIGPNSSSFGITEAHTAASIGPSNLYGNPANMTFEDRSSIGADYTLWLLDTKLSHAAGTFVKENHAFGAGIISSKIDDIQARSQPGPSDGNFSVSYLSIAGAYAHQITGNIALGVTGQFLNEQYLLNQASGYAFNLGLSSRWLNNRLRVAASVANLGKMGELDLEATRLPTNARFGISANLVEFTTPGANDLPILVKIHSDFVYPMYDRSEQQSNAGYEDPGDSFFNVATEIEVGDIAILRGGYQTRRASRKVSLGAGFWIEDILFNYTVNPFRDGFPTGHSIGLHYYFD